LSLHHVDYAIDLGDAGPGRAFVATAGEGEAGEEEGAEAGEDDARVHQDEGSKALGNGRQRALTLRRRNHSGRQ
jgi:hypothetical protein